MTLKDRLARLGSGGFVRAVGVLAGGSVLAQILTAAAMPVVTRLYSPADFSLLAVFVGLTGILGAVAGLRFDLAVPLPETQSEAANVLALALLCSTAFAGILGGLVVSAPGAFASLLGQPALEPFLWLLPLAVLMFAWYSALQMWSVRASEFAALAKARVAQAAAGAAAQIGLGWSGAAPLGLFVGQILNTAGGCGALLPQLLRTAGEQLPAVTWRSIHESFVAYIRFPKYSTLEALSNGVSSQLPIFMIAALAAKPEAGQLLLASYVMQAPMSLFGGAVGQVYLSRAPEEYRQGRLGELTLSVMEGLLKSGVGSLIFAGIVAPALFDPVFGAQWHRAGDLVAWMAPWFVMQFLAVPVSMALHVTGRQRAAMALQLFGLLLRVAVVYAAYRFRADWISEAYAISGVAFYGAYIAVVLRATNVPADQVLRAAGRSVAPLAGWIAAGAIVLVVFQGIRWMSITWR